MIYGSKWLSLAESTKEEVKDEYSIESLVYDEYLNRKSLLEACTDEAAKPILEAQVEVLYEVGIKDIFSKIGNAIKEILKRIIRFIADIGIAIKNLFTKSTNNASLKNLVKNGSRHDEALKNIDLVFSEVELTTYQKQLQAQYQRILDHKYLFIDLEDIFDPDDNYDFDTLVNAIKRLHRQLSEDLRDAKDNSKGKSLITNDYYEDEYKNNITHNSSDVQLTSVKIYDRFANRIEENLGAADLKSILVPKFYNKYFVHANTFDEALREKLKDEYGKDKSPSFLRKRLIILGDRLPKYIEKISKFSKELKSNVEDIDKEFEEMSKLLNNNTESNKVFSDSVKNIMNIYKVTITDIKKAYGVTYAIFNIAEENQKAILSISKAIDKLDNIVPSET